MTERIGRWFRGTQERRSAPRFAVPALCVYYWDAGAPAPHEIVNISETGAYLVTRERWRTGTLIDLIVQETKNSQNECTVSPLVLRVPSTVVRVGPNGLGVQFRYPHAAERRRFRRFLDSAKRAISCSGNLPEAAGMEERLTVPDVVRRTCSRHGLDPDAFVAMLRRAAPEAISGPEFTSVLRASLEWLPALTGASHCVCSTTPVDEPGRDTGRPPIEESMNVIDVVADTCVQHGLDPAAFVEMMKSLFGVSISDPREASDAELMRFLLATLEWAAPPSTQTIQRRRSEAKAKWSRIPPPAAA